MNYLAALVCLAVVLGCRSSDGEPAIVEPPTSGCISIGPTVSPSSATIHVGDTLRVTAASASCFSSEVAFGWLTTDTTVATVDSVSGTVRGRRNGIVTVIAFERSDPTVKGAMVLSVVP